MDIDVNKESLSSGNDFINSYHSTLLQDDVRRIVGTSSHLVNPKEKDKNSPLYNENGSYLDIVNSTNVTDKELKKMMSGSTLSQPEDMIKNRFNNFSRFGYIDPAHEFISGAREYVFFSKPDLHLMNPNGTLYNQLQGNSFLVEAYNHYRYSFYCLQQYFESNNMLMSDDSTGPGIGDSASTFNIKCKYIPLLSNMISSSLDLSDITAGDVENNKNLYQINTTYREGSITSDLQFDFSTEFKDTKYLDVYVLFKTYDEYFRQKFYADIEPNRPEYITARIYPEAISIWKVIVDDTDRIIFWAKAIGCTPMNVPRGTLSNLEGTIKFTINWKAQFVKDMDPINLMELNYLTKLSMSEYDYYNAKIARLTDGETWAGLPYVIRDDDNFNTSARTGEVAKREQKFYKLAWLK